MKAIEIMMNEHRVIERLIIVVRQICKGIMNG